MISLQKQIQWLSRIQIGLLIAMAVGSAGFYLGYFKPNVQQLRQISFDIQDKQRQIQANLAAANDLESLKKQVLVLEDQIKHSKQLTNQPELPKFIRDVTQFSHNSGLMRFNCVPNEKLSLKYCAELPIALEFSGPFNDVVGFLRQTESMNRMTRTRSLSIRARRDGKNGVVDVKISMSLFYSED